MKPKSERIIKVGLLHALSAAWTLHGLLPDDDTEEAGIVLTRIGELLGVNAESIDTAEGWAEYIAFLASRLAFA